MSGRPANDLCKQGVSHATCSAKVQQGPLTAGEHGHQHTEQSGTMAKRPALPLARDERAPVQRPWTPAWLPSSGMAIPRITRMSIGSDQTRLIVLRGNSGSGKSTVAKALREVYGRGVAWVSQDLIRRIILKEKDQPARSCAGAAGAAGPVGGGFSYRHRDPSRPGAAR